MFNKILSDLPSNLGFIDLSFLLSIFDPSSVSNTTWKFSLYFSGQLPNLHFKIYFLNSHLESNSSVLKFFGNLS